MDQKPSAYKHLSLEQRQMIEMMHCAGVRVQDIADQIGVNRGSVYRELKRGSVDGVYSARESQKRYEKNLAQKGCPPTVLRDEKLQTYIRDRILNDGWSVGKIAEELRKNASMELKSISRQTIYAAIEEGYIPGVTMESVRNRCATVQKDGSLYIPKWFLDVYGIKEGQRFELSEEDGRFVLEREE